MFKSKKHSSDDISSVLQSKEKNPTFYAKCVVLAVCAVSILVGAAIGAKALGKAMNNRGQNADMLEDSVSSLGITDSTGEVASTTTSVFSDMITDQQIASQETTTLTMLTAESWKTTETATMSSIAQTSTLSVSTNVMENNTRETALATSKATVQTSKTTAATTIATTSRTWWSPPESQTSSEFKIEEKTGSARPFSSSEINNYPEYNLAFQEIITRDGWDSADLEFFLCDLNSDEIPELFIVSYNDIINRDEIFYVYALKDQAPIELWSGGGSGASGYNALSIMKSGYLCHSSSYGGYGGSTYYQYTGGTALIEVESVSMHDDIYTWSSPGKEDQTITEEIYNQIDASYGDVLY